MTDKKEFIDNLEGASKYNFKTDADIVFTTGTGLSEETVRAISAYKHEPKWMLERRLKSLEFFKKMPLPRFGPDLNFLKFDEYTYYKGATKGGVQNWNEVPEKVKDTFEKLGIPEAEQKYLAGVSTQFDSSSVYHNMLKKVEEKGVIFCSSDEGLRKYPDLFKKYFGTVIPICDNKFTALNNAFWSGGSFIYVPKGVKLEKPLQSYFRINSEKVGQFERTLIILDEGADISYVEGCTAPKYDRESLHCSVVEIILMKNAHLRYTAVQNWSKNIVNLITQRTLCKEGAFMEWIDGNVGSMKNQKYPACILEGDGSKGSVISVAVAQEGQYQDSGARMIHIGKNTSSTVISKSICKDGGTANYRGTVRMMPGATNAHSHIECDTLMLDDISHSDTLPKNEIRNNTSYIEHEATVSKISEDQLFYLMSRGLTEAEATQMIVMGFIQPFSKELPMEYAAELNQLIKLDMTDAIG